MPPTKKSSDLDRFLAKIEVDADGCWLWTASLIHTGYGRLRIGSRTDGTYRTVMAHRWAYEHYIGPLGSDQTVDHLCHNADDDCEKGNACKHRRCVNPEHLEAVTSAVNISRGKGHAPRNAEKTHCVHGHPFSGDNLYVDPSGKRRCRECKRAYNRRAHKKPERKEANRQYRQSEKGRARRRERYRENIEDHRAYQRDYYHRVRKHQK